MGELFRVPDCDFLIVNNQCAAACFGRARRHETPSTLTGVAMSTVINRLAWLLNRPQAEPPVTRFTHVTVANFAAPALDGQLADVERQGRLPYQAVR